MVHGKDPGVVERDEEGMKNIKFLVKTWLGC